MYETKSQKSRWKGSSEAADKKPLTNLPDMSVFWVVCRLLRPFAFFTRTACSRPCWCSLPHGLSRPLQELCATEDGSRANACSEKRAMSPMSTIVKISFPPNMLQPSAEPGRAANFRTASISLNMHGCTKSCTSAQVESSETAATKETLL